MASENIPNKATLKVFKDTDEGKNIKSYETADEMFKALGMDECSNLK